MDDAEAGKVAVPAAMPWIVFALTFGLLHLRLYVAPGAQRAVFPHAQGSGALRIPQLGLPGAAQVALMVGLLDLPCLFARRPVRRVRAWP